MKAYYLSFSVHRTVRFRGTQRRFSPKYDEKTFQAIQSTLDLCKCIQIQTRNLLNQRPFLPPPYCHR